LKSRDEQKEEAEVEEDGEAEIHGKRKRGTSKTKIGPRA
jgi:hypothetical protein